MTTEETIAALDRGEVRVAEPDGDGWIVNEDVQAAILDYFRTRQMEPREVGPFEYHDKIPLKSGYEELGVRVVPPAVARYGSFLSRGVILMPSYVNIGGERRATDAVHAKPFMSSRYESPEGRSVAAMAHATTRSQWGISPLALLASHMALAQRQSCLTPSSRLTSAKRSPLPVMSPATEDRMRMSPKTQLQH